MSQASKGPISFSFGKQVAKYIGDELFKYFFEDQTKNRESHCFLAKLDVRLS